MKHMQNRLLIFSLVFAVAIESVSGFYGGLTLVIDSSGGLLQMPISLLEGTMFPSFLIPGIILLTLIGILPLFLIYPLLVKPDWPFINKLNIYKSYHWAWTYTLYNSIILISWINIQLMILNQGAAIHGIVGFWGTIILVLLLSPPVKKFYRLSPDKDSEK